MDRVLVVGSGASGVHFALTLLRRGKRVTLVDVGHPGAPAVAPEATLNGLKARLPDPAAYFLGDRFEGVLLPGDPAEYYGIPPSKGHVFRPLDGFDFEARGFAPLFSFARGGLAEVWTGGCYPFHDEDLRDFPFGWTELEPRYAEIARRIGISGTTDDLASFLPPHANLLPPLEPDGHTRHLLDAYGRKRARLHRRGFRLGRSRVAALTTDLGERKACTYLGRCLWGCPTGAFYTPSLTLEAMRSDPNFEYVSGVEAVSFRANEGGRIVSLSVRRLADGAVEELALDRLVLAAGTLGTARIVLRSLRGAGVASPALSGLMDNRQVLVPFVSPARAGRRFEDESYPFHLLALTLDAPDPRETVFGLVTTLKTALVHPIAQALPFDLRTSLDLTRALHAALGLVNVNFHDTRREGNRVTLDPDDGRLAIEYAPPPGESGRVREALRRLRRALWTLGAVAAPGMARRRPMGASVHYAGTLPMSREGGPGTTTPSCRSRDFENLWIADGSTFPFLPAKNVTFTLMANAVRVAETDF